MKSILVYDASLRIFHAAFAASLTAALVLALAVDKHSAWFAWHILFGLAAEFLLLLRVALGFVGSRYARFAHLPVGPTPVVAYVRGLLNGQARRHAGHNPGSAWAALVMFTLVPALLATGWWAGGEPWEAVHGFLAYALIAVIGVHLAGLVWHTVQYRENIAMAMLTGRKIGRPEDAIASSQPAWAVVFVVAAAAWIGGLFANHRAGAASIRLPLTSVTVPLGEDHDGEKTRSDGKRKHRDELSRLSDYVDQCLLLPTAEQSRLTLRVESVPLRTLVLEMIETYELLARESARHLSVLTSEDVLVQADPSYLRQVLHNLLTNALRHGKGAVEVAVGGGDAGAFCRVSNVPADHPAARAAGTGIGLRIVRALAGLHPGLTFTGETAGGKFVAELRWR